MSCAADGGVDAPEMAGEPISAGPLAEMDRRGVRNRTRKQIGSINCIYDRTAASTYAESIDATRNDTSTPVICHRRRRGSFCCWSSLLLIACRHTGRCFVHARARLEDRERERTLGMHATCACV